MGYDIWLTGLSVIVAVVLTGGGFAVSLANGDRRADQLLGGAIVGFGVFAMHYTGMAALRVPAVVTYDAAFVVTSLALGMGFAAPAVRMALAADGLLRRLTAAQLLAAAICGLHFTAMAAVTLDPSPLVSVPEQAMPPEWLAFGVALTALVILGAGLASSIVDQRVAAAGLLLVRGDARRLRQVLLNLLSNAVKFTPKDGAITLSAEQRGADIAIVVADTGIGMAPEHIGVALARFGQVDNRLGRRYEGTGLGLPLVKRLVELHGALSRSTARSGAAPPSRSCCRPIASSTARRPPDAPALRGRRCRDDSAARGGQAVLQVIAPPFVVQRRARPRRPAAACRYSFTACQTLFLPSPVTSPGFLSLTKV